MSIMHKTTVYSLYTFKGGEYVQARDGYLLEQGCAVYRLKPGVWHVVDMDTGLSVCSAHTRTKAVARFRAVYLSELTAYRLNHAEDYKAKMERMNTLYEDYIKGTC